MAAAKDSSFWQKLSVATISGAIIVFFGWLSFTVLEVKNLSARMDERTILMGQQISGLVSAEKARTERQVEENSERLNIIQSNVQ